jgi:hypothetical protein
MSRLDRGRLARVLGMVGSAHDGEVISAARLANRMVRAAGCTWVQVLAGAPAEAPRCHCHVCRCERLLGRARALTDWELKFCCSLLRRESEPTAKQNAVLDRLSRRIEAAA